MNEVGSEALYIYTYYGLIHKYTDTSMSGFNELSAVRTSLFQGPIAALPVYTSEICLNNSSIHQCNLSIL